MLVRSGLARLLSDAGIEVVGEASDAEGLLRGVGHQHPDVAVVDIRMPPTHTDEGLLAARRIRDDYPKLDLEPSPEVNRRVLAVLCCAAELRRRNRTGRSQRDAEIEQMYWRARQESNVPYPSPHCVPRIGDNQERR